MKIDIHGRDNHGLDKPGHDKHCLENHGLDKHYFDKHGFYKHCLDKHGCDKHGHNKHALDKHGFDKLLAVWIDFQSCYGTEIEIWAGFGPVGNTEKKLGRL